MLRAALLLACASAVSTNNVPGHRSPFPDPLNPEPLPSQVPDPNNYPWPIGDYDPFFNRDDSTTYPPPLAPKPIVTYNPQDVILNPKDVLPLIPDDRKLMPKPSFPWSPPPYIQNLKDIEKSLAIELSHFTKEAIKDRRSKDFRYIIIEHVVNELAKEVAKNGWNSYATNYNSLVRQYVDSGVADPQTAVHFLKCETDATETAIQRIKHLIHHPAIQYVCATQPSSCDAVIWTAIYLEPGADILQSAAALQAAAGTAKLFLDYYDREFEAISTQNVVYQYLTHAKRDLQPLVASLASLKKHIKTHNC